MRACMLSLLCGAWGGALPCVRAFGAFAPGATPAPTPAAVPAAGHGCSEAQFGELAKRTTAACCRPHACTQSSAADLVGFPETCSLDCAVEFTTGLYARCRARLGTLLASAGQQGDAAAFNTKCLAASTPAAIAARVAAVRQYGCGANYSGSPFRMMPSGPSPLTRLEAAAAAA